MVGKVRMSGPTLKLLTLLMENPQEPRSGASISKATGLGSGTMYPLLQRLEMAKWIEGKWEKIDPSEIGRPKRRFYKLTATGQNAARKALAEYSIAIPGVPVWS